jgi:cbb3-type cytochrome oxidase cytochrome c subunit
MVVNRLYYSSSLFILLPISVYYFTFNYSKKILLINILLLLILSSTYIFSKYNNVLNHNYYKNIKSIKNSFKKDKISFNLSEEEILHIGQIIRKHEKDNIKDEILFYYCRADIAFVIKYIYDKPVYWKGRRANPDYKKIYQQNKHIRDYKHILIEAPKEFSKFKPYY